MEVADAVRQVEELLTLQDNLGKKAIDITTPALFTRLQRIGPNSSSSRKLDVKKQLAFDIIFSQIYPNELKDLILSIEFPLDYPSCSTCTVKAINVSDQSEYKDCSDAIADFIKPFSGCECIEMILDWIVENKDSCLTISSGDGSVMNDDSREGKSQCFVLRYNHLFTGPEHKKEKAMVDAAKKAGLQGGILWGTPGIVVVVPDSTEEDAKEYGSECRTIGKRPDGVEEIWLPDNGLETAGMGGLAQQKRGGKLQELDTVGLRKTCENDEDLLRHVLGVK